MCIKPICLKLQQGSEINFSEFLELKKVIFGNKYPKKIDNTKYNLIMGII